MRTVYSLTANLYTVWFGLFGIMREREWSPILGIRIISVFREKVFPGKNWSRSIVAWGEGSCIQACVFQNPPKRVKVRNNEGLRTYILNYNLVTVYFFSYKVKLNVHIFGSLVKLCIVK